MSTLKNLSVNPIHSHRNSIVASQLTCLMLHCSGHFLQTFCSVSHLLYLYKFLPCSFFRTRILTFYDKKIFPHSLIPSIIHSVDLIISIILRDFFRKPKGFTCFSNFGQIWYPLWRNLGVDVKICINNQLSKTIFNNSTVLGL